MDAAGCSFVSVTQAFNTSSSMGRLTLNVLLSFAQFEREVTAERIRDKIAASKKKGLWMGGIPPLGYDPHPDPTRRELVVNAAEAEVVRSIFDLYGRHGCLNRVVREAARLNLRSKHHRFSTGRVQGGTPFSRGQIYHLLTNPVYRGLIRHKDKTWPGIHAAIVTEELWDKVQASLVDASARRRGAIPGTVGNGDAPLKGKLRDETGDLLTPSHTNRQAKRFRYYISNRLVSGGTDAGGWRLSAPALEQAIARIIANHLSDSAAKHEVLAETRARTSSAAAEAVHDLANRIRADGILPAARLLSSGIIHDKKLALVLDRQALSDVTKIAAADLAVPLLSFDRPFTCKRRGIEMKIVVGEHASAPDATLLNGLRNAHRWATALKSGRSLSRLAAAERVSARYISRIVPLASLSPKLQAAIVAGTQPADLTLERLVRTSLPLSWAAQEHLFGDAI